MSTESKIIAHCRKHECNFEWVVLYLPQPIDVFSEAAKRAYCPKCGDTKPMLGPAKVSS